MRVKNEYVWSSESLASIFVGTFLLLYWSGIPFTIVAEKCLRLLADIGETRYTAVTVSDATP
jgi:hypothetical protein